MYVCVPQDYFTLEINTAGCLVCVPELLPEFTPLPELLPLFLIRLATDVDWSNEQECFKNICYEFALWYCQYTSNALTVPTADSTTTGESDMEYNMKNKIIPAIKDHLYPSEAIFVDMNGEQLMNIAVPIAALEDLYKVFERC